MCGINGILHLQSQKKVDERILNKNARFTGTSRS